MLIGVVILNYKTYKDTERLVNDILKQTSPYDIFIQVVDNCSPNESYSYLSKRFSNTDNVSVFESNHNGGFAKGNNIGLRLLEKLKPDYVLVINNDVHFNLSVLEECIEANNKLPSPGIVSPIQYGANGKPAIFSDLRCNTFIDDLCETSLLFGKLFKRMDIQYYYSNTKWDNVQEVDTVPGCFIFIDFNIFKRIGYFDETTFLFCEERFLFKKLNNIGFKNYILLDCSYIHDHSLTINSEVSNINQLKMLNDGYVAFTRKYRKYPSIKVCILRLAFQVRRIEIKLLSFFTKIKANVN